MKTLLASGLMTVMACTSVWGQQPQVSDDRPKITVGGEAVVNVKPDRVVVSFGIETWDANIIVAKQKNNDILKKAVAAMKECGVPEKEIQTDQLSIEPRWHGSYEKQDFIGYFVNNTVMVTLSDVKTVEQVVSSALAAGVHRIHGLDFQTTELKKYREEARDLALKAAKEKAEKMSAVLGQTIGKPLQIDESYTGSRWYGGWSRDRSSGMSQVQVQADRGSSGEITDTVALGKLAVRANVSVTFELKE
jgi:uncharacterized protein YggE